MNKEQIPSPVLTALRGVKHPITTARKLVSKVGIPSLTWRANLGEEVRFWNAYLKTQGLEWHEDYLRRLDPEAPLQPHVTELLPEGDVSILDVGAGPLTKLGKVVEGRRIKITAVDPLADAYDKLLSKYNVTPPVRTTYGQAESLREQFPANHFDLVHAENCIDHSFNPLKAFEQMVEVVKTGCYVFARHEINEGENEGYAGLHQWNFFTERGEFLIGNRAGRPLNVSERLRDRAEVQCEVEGRMLTVRMKRSI